MKYLTALLAMLWLEGCFSGPQKSLKPKADELFRELKRQEFTKPVAVPPKFTATAAAPEIPAPQKQVLSRSGNVPFETEGFGSASKFERRIDAEKRAEEDAISKALQNAGVDVYYGFSDLLAQSGEKGTEMIARYLWTFSSGVATWRRLGEPNCVARPNGNTECRMRVKGQIHLNGRPDPSFEILLNDASQSLGLSHLSYRNGENVEVRFRMSQNATVYIFSVDEEQNAYLIFPNRTWRSNQIESGKVFTFPPNASGLSLVAVLPEGRSRSVEMLQIVATKEVPLLSLDGLTEKNVGHYKALSAGTLGKVMSKLARLDRGEWTMAVLPYEIRQ